MSFWNFKWLTDAFSDAWNWLKGAVEDAIVWIGNAFTDVVDWFKNAFSDAGEWLVGAFNDFVDWLVDIIPDWMEIHLTSTDVTFSTAALTAENAPDDAHEVAFGEDVTTYQAQDGKEFFKFGDDSTGDAYAGQADIITNFDASEDTISIPEGLVYSGSSTSSPPLGTYSVWEKEDGFVVTWLDEDGWNDIQVKGDNPLGAVVSKTQEKNIVIAGTDAQVLNASEGEDVFVVASETAGHSFSGQEKVIDGFDPEDDVIILPDGLINTGNASSAGSGQFVVYKSSETYSDVELDPWDAMYWNIPQAPKDKFVVEWNDGNGPSQILVDEDPTGKVFSGLDALS